MAAVYCKRVGIKERKNSHRSRANTVVNKILGIVADTLLLSSFVHSKCISTSSHLSNAFPFKMIRASVP